MFTSFNFKNNPVVTLIIVINLIYFIILEAAGGSTNRLTLVYWGAKEGISIARGDYWRLITPIFMHIGLFHLISNTIGLIIFGPVIERIFGAQRLICIYVITGAWGNVASFLTNNAVGAGGSGALFGLAGVYASYLFINRGNLGGWGRESLVGLSWIIGINLIFGFTLDGIDNSAHLGGLVAGWIIGILLCPVSRIILTSEVGSIPVFIEKTILSHKKASLWAVMIVVNIILLWLSTRAITSMFY